MPARAATKKLDFSDKLVQAGKSGGTGALLERLTALHQKLRQLDQDVDKKSLGGVRKQLIEPVILHHKDRGVKITAACCLSEMLRLYAPDAPYTLDEVRDIFQFFIVQLTSNLKSTPAATKPLAPSRRGNAAETQTTLSARLTDTPYFAEYAALLQSMAESESPALILETSAADELVVQYFDSFLEIARPDMGKSMTRYMVTILNILIANCSTVPTGVMESIFSQFETYSKKPETPSFALTLEVCKDSGSLLQRPVFQHFSELQLQHGRDPSPTDQKVMEDSHELLLTIYRRVPKLLLNVIPLLEDNLRAADEVFLRQLSTRTLGAMVGLPLGTMAKEYPSAWRSWRGRKVDKAVQVRVAWAEATGAILANQPELRSEIEDDLKDRLLDSDERVRAAVCKVVGGLGYDTALHSLSLLKAVGGRISDKKAGVRQDAIDALCKLWTEAYPSIEQNDPDAIESFGWIPQEMLVSLRRKDVTAELRNQVNIAMRTSILPLPVGKADDDQAWIDRFILVASHVDEGGLLTLDNLSGLPALVRGTAPWLAFVDLCEKNKGGAGEDVRQGMAYVTDFITKQLFSGSDKGRKDLEEFAALNDARLYRLLRTAADPQSDLRAISKARAEFIRRVEQSHTALQDTLTTVMDFAALIILNQTSIPGLIKRLQKSEPSDRGGIVAARYLYFLAKTSPPMFKSHMPVLTLVLNEKRNEKLVEVAMQGLAAVSKWNPELSPNDSKTLQRVKTLALTGTPRQAKFAARFLAHCKNAEARTELISSVAASLEEREDEHLLALLHASSELAIQAPTDFEAKADEIIAFILNNVMPRPSPSQEDEEEIWVDEEALETIDRAKLVSLRVLSHHAYCRARDQHDVAQGVQTIKLLNQVLANDGAVTELTAEGGRARCHMRLRATLCLLKLAYDRSLDKEIGKHFLQVAFSMQDLNFQVRQRLLKKLGDVLPLQRCHSRWNLLPIMVAQDPEPENIQSARGIMAKIVVAVEQRRPRPEERLDRLEMPLARLLYMLAQHPDLDWTKEAELKDLAKFIEFFMECLMTRENAGLLYAIANKLKTVHVKRTVETEEPTMAERKAEEQWHRDFLRKVSLAADGETDEDDQDKTFVYTLNLWKLSEMAQILIKTRAHHMGISLTVSPAKLKLWNDIFDTLPAAVSRQVASHTFLSTAVEEWLQSSSVRKSAGARTGAVGASRRTAGTGGDGSGSPKKRRRGGPKAPRKKRQRTSRSAESETDAESEYTSDEEAEVSDAESAGAGSDADDATGVLGRGGRRSAKTKAKRRVTRKAKANGSKARETEESDLTELSE